MITVPKSTKISLAIRKAHAGEVAISLNGKVIAVGKNSVVAFKKAKRVIPDINDQEFVVSRIHHKYLAV